MISNQNSLDICHFLQQMHPYMYWKVNYNAQPFITLYTSYSKYKSTINEDACL